jgi:hypothetical protein
MVSTGFHVLEERTTDAFRSFSLRNAEVHAARGGRFSKRFPPHAYNGLSSFLSLAVEYAPSPHWNVDARTHKEKASRRDKRS